MAYYQNPKFLFGKYQGKSIANVPRDYLEWYVSQPIDDRYQSFKTAVLNQLAKWDSMKK